MADQQQGRQIPWPHVHSHSLEEDPDIWTHVDIPISQPSRLSCCLSNMLVEPQASTNTEKSPTPTEQCLGQCEMGLLCSPRAHNAFVPFGNVFLKYFPMQLNNSLLCPVSEGCLCAGVLCYALFCGQAQQSGDFTVIFTVIGW